MRSLVGHDEYFGFHTESHKKPSQGSEQNPMMQKQVETRKLFEGWSDHPDNAGGLDQDQQGWLHFAGRTSMIC